jgi:hypothetical protein
VKNKEASMPVDAAYDNALKMLMQVRITPTPYPINVNNMQLLKSHLHFLLLSEFVLVLISPGIVARS